MARTWIRLIGNSVGVAVVIVAAQLCVAQSLQIMRWRVDSDSAWRSLLAWVVFIYATGVLAGSTVGRRSLGKAAGASTTARVVAALFSVLGAALAIVLVWLPARDAKPPVAVYPGLVVVMAAGAGVVAGLIVALAALSAPAVAGNIRATATWVWLAAIFSAAAGLATHQAFSPPRLAVVDAPSVVSVAWWSGPNLMIGVSALLGLSLATVARWGGARRRGVAVSGLAGPAVVAAAYLIAGPGSGATLVAPYRAALLALAAGLGASVVVALPRGRQARTRGHQARTGSVAAPPAEDRPIVGEVLDPDRSPVGAAVMGQPKRSPDDDYTAWLKGLGNPQRI